MPTRSFPLPALILVAFTACISPQTSRSRPHLDPADAQAPEATLTLPGRALAEGLQASHHLDTTPPENSKSFTCPMHPHFHAAQLGRCPDCGMRLVPESSPTPSKGTRS